MNDTMIFTEKLLSNFGHLSLESLNTRAPLLKRIDRKFVFRPELLPLILDECKNNYSVLDINGEKIFYYQTHYYDTADLVVYFLHHNNRPNRFKIRKRIYLNSNACFLEVKIKDNKKNTIKHRISTGAEVCLDDEPIKNFLAEFINTDATALLQSITVNYSRITLLSHSGNEKITLDLMPEFINSSGSYQYKNIVIAEVKTKKIQSSFFSSLMKNNIIKQCSVSKYCLGMITLNSSLKQNNFKSLYNHIKKIDEYGL